jgi:uncharacterized protein GlcG (DUF336 family)
MRVLPLVAAALVLAALLMLAPPPSQQFLLAASSPAAQSAPAPVAPLTQDTAVVAAATLSHTAANRMLDAAEQRARELGVPMSIAIVDAGRNLKAFRRMDGATINSVQASQDKAYTSASFGEDTRDLWARAQNAPPFLTSISHQPRVYLSGGGQVIRVGGQMVGAIGVGGSNRAGEDDMVAEAARAILPE